MNKFYQLHEKMEQGHVSRMVEALNIPLTRKMWNRLSKPEVIDQAWHITTIQGAHDVKKIQRSSKELATFTEWDDTQETIHGVSGFGQILLRLSGEIVIWSDDDFYSQLDTQGRRWIPTYYFSSSKIIKYRLEKIADKAKQLTLQQNKKALEKFPYPWGILGGTDKHHNKEKMLIISGYIDNVDKLLTKDTKLIKLLRTPRKNTKNVNVDHPWNEIILTNFKIKEAFMSFERADGVANKTETAQKYTTRLEKELGIPIKLIDDFEWRFIK